MIRGYRGFWGGVAKGALDTHEALLREEEFEQRKENLKKARELADIQIEQGRLGLDLVRRHKLFQDEMEKVYQDVTTQEVPRVTEHGEVYDMERVPKPYNLVDLAEKMSTVMAKHGKLTPEQLLTTKARIREFEDTKVGDIYQNLLAGNTKDAVELLKKIGVDIDPDTLMSYDKQGPFKDTYKVFVARTRDGGHFTFEPYNMLRRAVLKDFMTTQKLSAMLGLREREVAAEEERSRAAVLSAQAAQKRAEALEARINAVINAMRNKDKDDGKPPTDKEVFSFFDRFVREREEVVNERGEKARIKGMFGSDDYVNLYKGFLKQGYEPWRAQREAIKKMEEHEEMLAETLYNMGAQLKDVSPRDRPERLRQMIDEAVSKGVPLEDLRRAIKYYDIGGGKLKKKYYTPSVEELMLALALERTRGARFSSEQLWNNPLGIDVGGSQFGLEVFGYTDPRARNPAWGKQTGSVATGRGSGT